MLLEQKQKDAGQLTEQHSTGDQQPSPLHDWGQDSAQDSAQHLSNIQRFHFSHVILLSSEMQV